MLIRNFMTPDPVTVQPETPVEDIAKLLPDNLCYMFVNGDPIEAIRLRATRLAVYRRGRCVAHSPAPIATLALPHRPAQVDGLHPSA